MLLIRKITAWFAVTPTRSVFFITLPFLAVFTVSALLSGVVQLRDLVAPLISIMGTFFGATFAFRLAEGKEARKQEEANRKALNRALFVLIRQVNATRQLVKEFEKFPSSFEKAFNMPALKPPPYQDVTHVLSDLDFLLGSEQPSLLMELTIEQERFLQAVASLNLRNQFYVDVVQPKVAELGLNGKTTTLHEAAELMGDRIYGTATNSVDFAWDHFSKNDVSIPLMHKKLLAYAKAAFPGHRFIDYEVVT